MSYFSPIILLLVYAGVFYSIKIFKNFVDRFEIYVILILVTVPIIKRKEIYS